MKRNLKYYHRSYLITATILSIILLCSCAKPDTTPPSTSPPPSPPTSSPSLNTTIKLPQPQFYSDVSIEQSLIERRSTRDYTDEPVTLQELSQLLWAAQGITDYRGFRTAPSAGALYPLETYVVASNVQDLAAGVYKYKPYEHELTQHMEGDKRGELADAALGQSFVKEGALAIVFAAVYERTMVKYGERGIRYVHMEVGHAAQNLCLQATAMGLGIVTVGAFHDDQVAKLLNLPNNEQPLYIIPVGRKQ